jgi:hypothetical protein
MLSTRILTASAWVVAAGFGASIAHADAPCNKGFRDSTPAERATMTAVLVAAKNALPPAPAGWQIVSGEETNGPISICRDQELYLWRYEFTRSYRQVGDNETRSKSMDEAAAYAAADAAKKQPRLDAIMAKMTKVNEQRVALLQKRDYAGAEKFDAEIVKLQAEYEKVANEGDSQAMIAAAGKEMGRDLEMSISVRVNPGLQSQDSSARNIALPPGAFAAARWDEVGDPERADQGHSLVLLGKWTRKPDGRWAQVPRPNTSPTAAHAIAITVLADPNRMDSTLQAIDFKSLSAALAK